MELAELILMLAGCSDKGVVYPTVMVVVFWALACSTMVLLVQLAITTVVPLTLAAAEHTKLPLSTLRVRKPLRMGSVKLPLSVRVVVLIT